MIFLFLECLLPSLLWYFVDFMDENKNSTILIVLLDTLDSETPVLQTFLEFFLGLLDIEDIDDNFNILEDSLSLDHEVVIHESILASTVPQVESQVAHELKAMLFSLNCVAYFVCLFGRVVGENHRMHGCLASPLATHQ